MKEIKQIKIKSQMKVSDLVEQMGGMGFQARNISEASDILRKMKNDKECKVFFGLAGAMVPSGMKQVIIDMIKEGYIDIIVSTGANLTHDLIEALGNKHYHGDSNSNDDELQKKGIDRIYNVFMKNDVYEKLEDFFKKNFEELQKTKSISEFLHKLGQLIENKNSILRVCYEENIPLFCPGISDSGIGLMMWGRIVNGKQSNIDVFSDMKDIIDISWTSKKRGVFYIGGGVPKNFIQQSLQFSKGADYGIQITTDRQESGGSSGAPLKEGISWGKMKSNANFVDIFCDASIALPLIFAAVKE